MFGVPAGDDGDELFGPEGAGPSEIFVQKNGGYGFDSILRGHFREKEAVDDPDPDAAAVKRQGNALPHRSRTKRALPGNIDLERRGKSDLFKRFSLDTFAALYILHEEKNVALNPRIKKAYLDAIRYISKKDIKDRINYVRNLK